MASVEREGIWLGDGKAGVGRADPYRSVDLGICEEVGGIVSPNIVAGIAGWVVFLFTVLSGVTVWQTIPGTPFFTVANVSVDVGVAAEIKTLNTVREFNAKRDGEIKIRRVLIPTDKAGVKVSLPDITVDLKPGTELQSRLVHIPNTVDGTWCEEATAYWKPMFSMIEHTAQFPQLCFTVPKVGNGKAHH